MVTGNQIDAGRSGLLRWRPPTGLAGAAFWLGVWFCLLWLLRMIPGGVGSFSGFLQILAGIALVVVTIPLLWQLVRRHMLWSLRNKLVLTYLLIGGAPVVLFVTLVTVSAYIAAGQFAIHLADTRLQAELNQMIGENGHRGSTTARLIEEKVRIEPPPAADIEAARTAAADVPRLRLHRSTVAFMDGVPYDLGPMTSNTGKTPFGLPPWATQLGRNDFQGLVLDNDELYLVAVHQQRLRDGRMFSLMTSLPVDAEVMDMIADGLGRAGLLPQRAGKNAEAGQGVSSSTALQEGAVPAASSATATSRNATQRRSSARGARKGFIYGGSEPAGVNIADIRVAFISTITITDWDTGEPDNILIEVDSRPSLLYRQLFGGSLGGIVTNTILIGLVLLCVVCALLEALALVMAFRVSRTITASVADLYEATQRIDRGEFNYRIGVKRDDQLAELSRSFNRMTGSLQRLLVEQKEKERLQNELSIAQEVQANLFPRLACDLPSLQLHGVCRPARSVSGDYYDFLVFHEEAHDGQPSRRETGVGIALGDISGKGISAALLMATLHSAVRAYRFASEELVYSESSFAGLTASREEFGMDCDGLFESPGRILSLLNRHLYRSTQPEKYATLFLGHYNAKSSVLTYSNAGQLPPLVLGRDGSIRRLDRGGTVVGLMDGMHYEEDRVQMRSGDILVAYSDGVTEPENDFGEFGEERLMEVVRRYRDQPLHVISAQVMLALDTWIGAEEQPDDITLVLARQV